VDCPCGRGAYATCCAPLHEGKPAADAEALMRSRYSAYALDRADYLLATWHASTRPASLDLASNPPLRWLGLDVKRFLPAGDTAVVEFVARHRQGGGSLPDILSSATLARPARRRAGRLHETSRFVREQDRWWYVDGDVDGT
jgi:SEC-C motif domain protein